MFCRHGNTAAKPGEFSEAERKGAKPFLEAGGVIVESLCWLAARQADRGAPLIEQALQVARYSYAHRDVQTGLVRNQPKDKRWDYYASTTEVGLWAGNLLRAFEYSGNSELCDLASKAVAAYIRRGFDPKMGKYYGGLAVKDGAPLRPETPRGYFPPLYAELFDMATHPTHNYPMPMAEACLTLFQKGSEPIFQQAVRRWVEHIRHSLPANGGAGAYAEDYGRVIHFLTRASQVLGDGGLRNLAFQVANEAVAKLYLPEHGMFRSHPGEDRCDAVDEPGMLFLALIYLETGKSPDLMGFGF